MGSLKTSIVSAGVVLVVGLAPFFWQQSQTAKLETEISDTAEKRVALQKQYDAAVEQAEREQGALSTGRSAPRTVGDLLAAADEKPDLDVMLDSMMELMMSQDIVGMIRMFLPLSNMTPAEYADLLEEVEQKKGNPQTKQIAMMMLGMFAPADNPQESLDRMVKMGVESYAYSNLLSSWGGSDPDAAIAWYEKELAAGNLDGKGIHNSPSKRLFSELLGGVASKMPGRAVDLFANALASGDLTEGSHEAGRKLGRGLGEELKESGNDSHLRRLLGLNSDENFNQNVIQAVVATSVESEDLDGAKRMINTYLENDDQQRNTLVEHVAAQHREPFAERMDWLSNNIEAEHMTRAAMEMSQRAAWNDSTRAEVEEWVTTQPQGAVRDSTNETLSDAYLNRGDYETALARANEIGDTGMRDVSARNIAERWFESDPEAARAALPPAVIDQVEASATKASE